MKKTIMLLCWLVLMLSLTACGYDDGSHEGEAREKGHEEAAYTEQKEQLKIQLGLLDEHVTPEERQHALFMLEEINVLKEERLQQGEYERSGEETRLLKELNDFYDSCTDRYLVKEDQYYEGEEVPEAETLAEYRVGVDSTLDPNGGSSITGGCPWSDEKIRDVWQEVMEILPKGADGYFAKLEVFTDGPDEMLAYVEQADDIGALWTLAIDPADYSSSDLFEEAIVHEYFHCLSLNDQQVIYTDEPSAEEYTEEYEKGAYCIYPEGSYVADFYEAFWTGYIDDREIDMESEYFYLRHEEDFVTDYAATIPAEDICESFAYFVLYDKDGGDAVWQQKIDFFWDYPELVEDRAEIRENLGL